MNDDKRIARRSTLLGSLGGKVFHRTGGVPVSLPGADLSTSLSSSAIDATEWNGPCNDMAFGLSYSRYVDSVGGWLDISKGFFRGA